MIKYRNMREISRIYKKTFIFLFLLTNIICWGIPLRGSAQDTGRMLAYEKQKHKAMTEAFAAEETKGRPVTDIEVKGNKFVSANTVISKMKTRIGSPYLENVVSEDLKRLYALGFFSDIKIDTQDYNEGVKIIISVVERPIIEKVSFTGLRRIRMTEDKLRKSLKSKENQYLDYPSLSEDLQLIRNNYEKRGFADVEVTHEVSVDNQTNKATVQFIVKEGRRLIIKNIFVEGNMSFSDKRILKLLKTKKAWLFNPGYLKEDVFKEDIERLKAFYRKEGFTDVKVDYDIKSHAYKPFSFITLKISEGRRFLVGSITVKGNKNISQKDIFLRLKKCLPGEVFSQDSLREDIAGIQSVYFENGYISAQVQETTYLNPHTGRIDITYNIIENQIAYVDKVKIRGNIKTKDIVIRREMRIKPGDKFDGDKLRRSKERLHNLGFFEEISYDTEDTDSVDQKNLIVDVKESKTGAFSFGGGYSSVDEFVGFVEVEQKNFDWRNFPYFTGDGQDLKLRASFGTVSEGFDLSFTEPWVFDYPVSFGFDLYKRKHEREQDIGYGYDEDITGGDIRLGKEISEYLRGNLTYRYDVIDIGNIPADATSDLKEEDGENTISSMEFGLSYDDRDNIFEPHKGNVLSGNIMLAGGPFAGDKDFFKFTTRLSKFFPLFRGSVLELRGRAGIADTYKNTDKVPIYERYFVGGAYTVRGYHERKIGPIDAVTEDPLGGESMMVGNVEYTFPILNFLKVAAFYDIGNVWAKAGDIGSSGFKAGFGFGLRVKTPIGPIMLDYGIPLHKEPGEEKKGGGRFHFSMSHGF